MALVSKLLSPLSLLLASAFFLSTNVAAVPPVLGVDLGTEYIKASLVKPGIPLEIVLTKEARRKEASSVAFKPERDGLKPGTYPERFYGSDALAMAPRFPADVYPNLKHILGLPFDHSIVREYAARYPGLQLEEDKVRGTVSLKSKAFDGDEEAWMVEELLAMQLQNIRSNAELHAGDGSSVRSIVLTVPPYFTTEEKRAFELAADLAGLKVMSFVSDGMAVGLHYATSRQFPNISEGEKAEYHLVFDIGAGSASATVMRFQSRTVKDVGKYNKTIQEIHVLGSGWDRSLGGDAFNSLIVDNLVNQFVESPAGKGVSATAEKIKTGGRTAAKLFKEAEKARHILSANSNTQGSIESLFEDVDFKYKLTREEFESMAAAHAETMSSIVKEALSQAQIEVTDLTSAILNGGLTRTPFVQKTLADVLGSSDLIRTSVNSDEASVLGAGFKAADLSPGFRVKEIRIYDTSNYAAGVKYTNAKEKLQHQKLWTPTSHLGGAEKEVTVPNHEDLTMTFYQLVGDVEQDTSLLTTKNLTASVTELKEKYSCEDSDIFFKLGVKLSGENGEVVVTKASVECEGEVTDKDTIMDGVKNLFGFGKKDQKPLGDDAAADAEKPVEASSEEADSATADAASEETPEATPEPQAAEPEGDAAVTKEKKKQLVVIPVDFALENTGVPTLPKDRIKKLKDRLKAFDASDKARVLRSEAMNQLEGYTYRVRDVLENEDFITASTEDERTNLQNLSSETSDWLYEDGADAPRDELQKRLKTLKSIVEPIQKRIDEAAQRPKAIESLKDALSQTDTFVETIKKQIKEYDDWHSSASAESASSTEESSSTVTEEPSSAGEFDGLEDDAAVTASPKAPTMGDVLEDRGPVPPIYTSEDIGTIEKLAVDIRKWLEEKEPKQNELPPTADPVLLVKDINSRREKLDKAGMELAMKGVKNFEAKNKKSGSKKAKADKSDKKAKADEKAKEKTKEGPTDEEIQEMLRKIQEEEARDTHDEL
ncbi:hypothetical protein jhhlp_008060 [Lomentospora prolificans]|uniref:Actin-like ATPase domain-containing protein n=1 Tax=Lomentospora prolificans TaxID=41688 RepID=A0A2N3MZD4_9PEZI|nr:hypothetical protein jhhlp_008060 [Lomentospora prolificans]